MTVIGAGAIWYRPKQVVPPLLQDPIVCTMEVKICPDGSYVGRSGPGCAFALCPKTSVDIPVTGKSAGIHQTVTIDAVKITPIGSIEDSRCPANVQCIQAGTVRVSVKLESSSEAQLVTMSIGVPVTFSDKKVTLISVLPNTVNTQKTYTPSEYRFTFSVTSGAAASSVVTSRLEGKMIISPICPVETVDNPCKPTAEEYASRKIAVYTTDRKTLLVTLIPDANGRFSMALSAGIYYITMADNLVTVDTSKVGVGSISGVPVTFTLKKGEVYKLTINIDTGMRLPVMN